jgi:hypothetical protein
MPHMCHTCSDCTHRHYIRAAFAPPSDVHTAAMLSVDCMSAYCPRLHACITHNTSMRAGSAITPDMYALGTNDLYVCMGVHVNTPCAQCVLLHIVDTVDR